MKKLTIILLSILFQSSVAQIASPEVEYEKNMPIREDGTKSVFNDQMLNILFADKVGTAFGGTNDLSLQKFFASLDASENSISIGANYDNRDKDTDKLSIVFTGGLKMKSKDKFSTFYKNGDFQENNIGAFFKTTWIFRGCINYTNKITTDQVLKRELAIKSNRLYLYDKYNKKTKKFNNEEANQLINKQLELIENNTKATSVDGVLKEKEEELYLEMAKEEIEYIEKNKLYRYYWNHWMSADIYIPFGENNYKTTSDVISNPLTDKNFYSISGSLTYNMMWLYSSGESIFLKAKGAIKNNNNIVVDAMTSTPFQTVTIGANNTNIITNTDDGYLTNFEKFITTTLTIEPAFFTLNNTVGFSPAIEFNAGKYNKTNWKLGIPVSLKDKDGKPKVNFELQWKEINTFKSSDHIVGVSVNFLFGEMIN
ncbi:hypothetical protein [Chryseobacterium indoltheticum]|uniref:hypothetical protein n=1 Tax=Chryseobacterium indoltheticum TaxID=254 RepID=UPI00404356BC